MSILTASRRTPKPREDEHWQELQAIEEALRETWGLGAGLDRNEKGKGYRGRLRRLCAFLRQLEPDLAGTTDPLTGLAAVEHGLAQPPTSAGVRHESICRLDDLRRALEAFAPARTGWTWSWQPRAGGSPAGSPQPERQGGPEQAPKALRALQTEESFQFDETPGSKLADMSSLLVRIEAYATGDDVKDRVKAARERYEQYWKDFADDWEWARVQVLVRLARECLRNHPFHVSSFQHAQAAKEALGQAIKWLESNGFNQSRAQGLHGMLAVAHLLVVKCPETCPKQRGEELKQALVYARLAVSLAPESSRARLVLLDVLSVLDDPEEIRAQAVLALELDSGTDTLRTIGKSYWDCAATLRDRRFRRRFLREAESFFVQALNNIKGAPLDEQHPLDQIEAHGWAHFWLGRFQSELGSCTAASAHLETACKLGFKPLEARVELAWTWLLARDRRQADRAFREAIEAIAEAGRSSTADDVVAALGENRSVAELTFEAHLGWAFLCADWDPDRAEKHAQLAKDLLSTSARADNPELKAAVFEVRGRVELHRRKLSQSLKLLQDSVRESPGSGAHCALGLAHLARARVAGKGASLALRLALEAYRLGRKSDIRRRHRRELRELRRELTKRGLLGQRQKPRKQPEQTAVPTIPSSPPVSTTPAPAAPATPPDQPEP
jgi:tetratricopeptide (TPR) repeat protein